MGNCKDCRSFEELTESYGICLSMKLDGNLEKYCHNTPDIDGLGRFIYTPKDYSDKGICVGNLFGCIHFEQAG